MVTGALHKKLFFISNSAHPCTEIALDANRIRRFYLANDWEEASDPTLADDLVVSTCAVNQEYEDAAMTDLEWRKVQLKTGARLIATGCLSKINPARFSEIEGALSVNPKQLGDFDSLVHPTVSIQNIQSNTIDYIDYQANPFFQKVIFIKQKLQNARKRFGVDLTPHWMATIPTAGWFYIRGGVGCRGQCTYCAVRRAKGDFTSVPFNFILKQTREAVAKGVPEISLAGDDMGAWGSDIGTNLAHLLSAMLKEGPDFCINIRFVEPLYFLSLLEELLPVFATGRISAFCLPIQSGSNSVLRRMARDYTIEAVEEGLQRLAALSKRPRLASIIMVGFPGETDQEYIESAKLIDRLPIDLFQILAYEGRPGTPSITMPDQVPDDVKEQRRQKLLRKFKLQNVLGLPRTLANRLSGFSY